METRKDTNPAYGAREVRLSNPNSIRWDRGTADERRRLIAEITDATLEEKADLEAYAIRLLHADGRLLAKTVLHRPLFASA